MPGTDLPSSCPFLFSPPPPEAVLLLLFFFTGHGNVENIQNIMKTMNKENCVPFSCFNVYVNVIIYYTEVHFIDFVFCLWNSPASCMVVFFYPFFITHICKVLSIVFLMDIWVIFCTYPWSNRASSDALMYWHSFDFHPFVITICSLFGFIFSGFLLVYFPCLQYIELFLFPFIILCC